MPLPPNGTSWPPAPYDQAFHQMREHNTWYVGDPTRLQAQYQGSRPRPRPSQYRGGAVGAVARFFWGRPAPGGQDRTRIHVPVPADLATTSADLLFSEPPRVVLPGETTDRARKPLQARLEEIINTPQTHAALLEAAEVAAALGGTYLRIAWDAAIDDKPFLTSVDADGAIPTFRWGRLTGVTFWTVVRNENQQVWRHVETHEPGRILHGLYQGTANNLGRQVPLQEDEATAWAADQVNADGAIVTGADGLAAAYVPNVRPNRTWRTTPELSPLGRSDFDGIEGLFDALDESYSSWMRDVRLAKARLIVDQGALKPLGGEGQGAVFDTDQELFTILPGVTGALKDGAVAQAEQFEIRTAEHRDTVAELVRAILRAAGYSAQTFDDQPLVVSTTATEVKARERMSARTRDKKARYWAAALAPLARTMLQVDAAQFRGPGANAEEPEVRFPPKTQEDTLELAQTAQFLRNAEAASTETLVRMVHPDWDGETVNEEVARIQAESALADPATFRPDVDDQDEPGLPDGAANDLGILVRSTATPQSAQQAVATGDISKVKFTGERPVTTRPKDEGTRQ